MSARARLGAAALGLCMAVSGASAMDIATYDKQRKESANSQTQVRLRVYLLGLGEGLRLANTVLQQQGQPMLFCATEGTALMGDDYKNLIDSALAESRGSFERQELSIEAIMLIGLQQRFPCAPKTPA
jgi:hypothetical protein